MSFYGSVSNAGKTTLTFDKVYPNRQAMETYCKEDGVFVGRCVLIEYDDNTFAYVRGYATEYPAKEELYRLYADVHGDVPLMIGENFPVGSEGNAVEEEGYVIQIGALVRARFVDRFGNIADPNTFFFVCEGIDGGGAAIFRVVNTSEEYITDYDLNYKIDKDYSEKRGYVFTNGWDSTVWQKIIESGVIKYRMIASLNSDLPTFAVRAEAPSIDAVAPHFGEDSTNMTYTLHMPTMWGFKVKNIEDAAEGESLYSDEKVFYGDKKPQRPANKDDKEEDEEEEEVIVPETDPDLLGAEYDGAIFYNKAGFNKQTRNMSDAENKISILPTGYSVNYPDYYVHDGESDKELAPDIQELTIQLPAIGNAIAELWDVMYGDKDADGKYLKSRNDNIEWNDTTGIRMITVDPDTGGFKYAPDKTESLAGAINSLHDLMGMIIVAPVEGQTKEEALETAISSRIYYGPYGENENQKGFFFKDTEYKFEPFATIPELNAKYEAEGKPVPFPDFDAENFVGSRTYYDLIQFLANTYYTYVDNNFYLDASNVPTPDTLYYLLGEPKTVLLKEWHGEVEDEETGETVVEDTYYKYNGNYIKDTSEVTDETKDYFSLVVSKETYPENHEETSVPRLIWNPQLPLYCPNDPGSTNTIENAENGIDWSVLISGTDGNGVPWVENVVAINKNGYFYLAYEELVEGEDPVASTLIQIQPTDEWVEHRKYYKIPIYAIREMKDETGATVRIPYFIKADGTLVSFEDAVDAGENGGKDDNLFPYGDYRINMIEFIPEYYFSEATFDIELEDGSIKTETGYQCLLTKDALDDSVIYYSIEATPLTGEGDITVETPEEGEGSEESSEDILLTHYYKPGVYYFKNSTNDYILSTSKSFDSSLTYYLLTDKNNELLEKDPVTKLFKIEPETADFYEPNKYYYFSNEFGANLMDTGTVMKTPDHPDVHPEYVREEIADDGTVKELVYFIPQEAYVVEDTAGFLSKGMVWDKNVEPPTTVTLGGRYTEPKWTELKGFSRALNTVNGLILQLNKYFKFDDQYVRDNSTVQGCLNQLKDLINLTDDLNPGNIMVIDDYGRISGGLLETDGWITAAIETKAKNTSLTLSHALPEVEDTELENAGQTGTSAPGFGGNIAVAGFKVDKNGHVRGTNSSSASITLPPLAVDNSATGNVMTGLAVSADGQSIVANKENLGELTVTSGNTLDSIDEKVTTLSADSSTPGSVAYQVAAVLNDADPSDIDTLEEIASWIVNDTTGAAKMSADINNLNALVGTKSVQTQINEALSGTGEGGTGGYATAESVTNLGEKVTKLEAAVSDENVAKWNAAEANVQVDWNEADTTSDAFILNKPDLTAYVTNTQEFTYDYNGTQTPMTIQALLTYIAGLEARIKTLEDAAAAPTT